MRALFICAILAMLPGCALFNTANPAGEQLIVQGLTVAAIQAGCSTVACYDARAAKIGAIAKVLETATPAIALSDLQTAIQNELITLKLTPEEIGPINVFISGVVAYLTPLVGQGLLSTAAVAIVQKVAGWIETVAASY
jgi:hypothetical protein